jgi:hypothetical protein
MHNKFSIQNKNKVNIKKNLISYKHNAKIYKMNHNKNKNLFIICKKC